LTSIGARWRSIDQGRLVGYSLAIWLILTVCLPVLATYLRFPNGPDRPQTLAVLDFRSTIDDRFIGTGISDTLRARLGSVQDITLRPAAAGPADKDALATGRDLKVDAILTGSVQRSDERIRVTVEMVDVEDGRIVWGKTFDDTSSNLFELQDAIVGDVARVLQVRFTSGIFDDAPSGLASFTGTVYF
jgi:TolB-like protein